MNLGKRIEECMGQIAPVTPAWNEADEHCIVYKYDLRGDGFGDDEPTFAVANLELHLYAPVGMDIEAEKLKIWEILPDELDTTMPVISDSSTLSYQHYVFICQVLLPLEELMNDGEL